MKKYWLFCLPVVGLILLSMACKNSGTEKTSGEAGEVALPASRNDSLMGWKGCDRAGFQALSATEHEFQYQFFKVNLKNRENLPGYSVEITLADSTKSFRLPSVEEYYFLGSTQNHLFFNLGPEGPTRTMVIYKLEGTSLKKVYQGDYSTFNPPFIANGNIWYYSPVEDEAEVTKKPECPERDSLVREGFGVKYAQRHLYNLVNRGLTRKSEFICIPVKE